VTLTLEERVEQLKARIEGFKLRHPHLYPPKQPEQKPVQAPTPTKQNQELNDLRKRLLGVK
jgi:hypothetical protein